VSNDKADQPKTGDGRKSGTKPKTTEVAQRLPNGVKMRRQPSKGWGRGTSSTPPASGSSWNHLQHGGGQ
jgi:hypothetical protein